MPSYRKSTSAKLFYKVLHKPQPDSVSIGYCPENIEQQILSVYLQQLTCKLEIIQLGLFTPTKAVKPIFFIPEINNLQAFQVVTN